jgi:hypothetical protein
MRDLSQLVRELTKELCHLQEEQASLHDTIRHLQSLIADQHIQLTRLKEAVHDVHDPANAR